MVPSQCVKSVRIRFSVLYFPIFGLNMERYGAPHRIQSECWKIKTKKTPNTDITDITLRNINCM